MTPNNRNPMAHDCLIQPDHIHAAQREMVEHGPTVMLARTGGIEPELVEFIAAAAMNITATAFFDSKMDRPVAQMLRALARGSTDVTVMWTVQDVQNLQPDWTRERCERFLHRHADHFASGMLLMGLDVLKAIAADPRFAGDGDEQKSEKS